MNPNFDEPDRCGGVVGMRIAYQTHSRVVARYLLAPVGLWGSAEVVMDRVVVGTVASFWAQFYATEIFSELPKLTPER